MKEEEGLKSHFFRKSERCEELITNKLLSFFSVTSDNSSNLEYPTSDTAILLRNLTHGTVLNYESVIVPSETEISSGLILQIFNSADVTMTGISSRRWSI